MVCQIAENITDCRYNILTILHLFRK